MRGQRASLNENGDGEVDENFWARAAADQAAGRATSDGEEGEILSHIIQQARV
jgi:condensin complex subunit 2